jgi:hypothetical protein
MPVEASYKTLPQASQDALQPYAGQPMNTGDEAQAFANHYIWEHMSAACTAVKDANGNAVPSVPAEKCNYSALGGVVSATTDANAEGRVHGTPQHPVPGRHPPYCPSDRVRVLAHRHDRAVDRRHRPRGRRGSARPRLHRLQDKGDAPAAPVAETVSVS